MCRETTFRWLCWSLCLTMPTVELTATADTFLKESGTTPWGGAAVVLIGKSSIEGLLYRTLLRFDASAIPPNSNIVSATLTLTATRTTGGPQTRVVECGRTYAGGAWVESQADWWKYDDVHPWPVPGASATDIVTAFHERLTPEGPGPLEVDVTSLVVNAIELHDGDVDLWLRFQDEDAFLAAVLFASRTHGAVDPPKITVYIEDATYTLTATDDGNGTVALDPETPQDTYPENTTVYLTVTPDDYYEFDAWAGADAADVQGSGTEADPYYIVMDSDKTIQATFTRTTYTYTTNAGANGEITVSGTGVTDHGDGTYTVEAGRSPSVSVTPDDGYQLDEYSSSTGLFDRPSTTLTTGVSYSKYWFVSTPSVMDRDEELTASFKVMNTLTLTEVNGDHGSLSVPAPGEITWTDNDEYPLFIETLDFPGPDITGKFYVEPDPGYQVTVTGDTATPTKVHDFGDGTVWEVVKPDDDLEITATFTEIAAGQETSHGWWQYPYRTEAWRHGWNHQ